MNEEEMQMTDIIYQTCKCKKLFPHVVMYRIHTLPFKSLQEENKGGSKGKRGVWAEACLDAQKQVHRSRVPLAAVEPGEGEEGRNKGRKNKSFYSNKSVTNYIFRKKNLDA